MTYLEFIAWIQGYYAPIPKGQHEDLFEYLLPMSPSYLDALRKVVVKKYSSQYGRAPDVAVFESCKPAAMDELTALLESRARLQIEPPIERGSGELMQIDWQRVFQHGLERAEVKR